jgi:hypothetical protein
MLLTCTHRMRWKRCCCQWICPLRTPHSPWHRQTGVPLSKCNRDHKAAASWPWNRTCNLAQRTLQHCETAASNGMEGLIRLTCARHVYYTLLDPCVESIHPCAVISVGAAAPSTYHTLWRQYARTWNNQCHTGNTPRRRPLGEESLRTCLPHTPQACCQRPCIQPQQRCLKAQAGRSLTHQRAFRDMDEQ